MAESEPTPEGPGKRTPEGRVVAMPRDTNGNGDIFGGWLMSQVDLAGSVTASRHARSRVTTVAVENFQFHKPVYVGDLVTCYTDIDRIGNTSITVEAQVFTENAEKTGTPTLVAEARLIYVAIDATGRPQPIAAKNRPGE